MLMLAFALASCATTNDPGADTDPEGTAAVTEADTGLKDNLPNDLDYDGDTITFITQRVDGVTWGEIAVPDLNGDPINDAVFERNKYVEKRLNVKINHIDEAVGDYEVVKKVATAVQSGSKDYDVLTSPAYVVLEQAQAGTFANLNGVSSYMDLEQPWWTQGFNDAISFQDTQYAAAGSILLSIYRSAYVTIFNQKLFNDADQTFLYDYVDNGTWTLDKQISLVPIFHRDNGNGTQDTSGDFYGLVTDLGIYVDPYWASCKVDIVGKDEDGYYEMVFDIDRLHEAADKALKLYYETDNGTYLGSIRSIFSQGYAAMATVRIVEMESSDMRNMADAYGVVPMPRLAENEEGYRSTLHDGFAVLAVPTTVRDARLEEVTSVLEAMGSASYRIVKPAYYETTLRTKLVSDPQSSAMMDMVIENLRTDAGYINVYSFNSFHHGFREIMGSKQNTVSSKYKGLQKATTKMVKVLNNKLTKLADTNA